MTDKLVKIDDNLIELVRSIDNRCLIFEMIKDTPGASIVVATLLEDLYQDCEIILESYCIVDD